MKLTASRLAFYRRDAARHTKARRDTHPAIILCFDSLSAIDVSQRRKPRRNLLYHANIIIVLSRITAARLHLPLGVLLK